MTFPPRTPSGELQLTSISSPYQGAAHETGPWVTRDDAEFLNSLCPTSAHDFPTLPGVPVDERSVAIEACTWGFRTLDDIFIDRLQRAQGFQQREHALLLAIYRKTFRVGKLLEKIPPLAPNLSHPCRWARIIGTPDPGPGRWTTRGRRVPSTGRAVLWRRLSNDRLSLLIAITAHEKRT